MSRCIRAFLLTFFVWAAGSKLLVHGAQIPAADQEKIIKNLRKSLSVMPNWNLQMKEITESPFPSLYQATMEFRTGDVVRSQSIFISTDSKLYIIGNLFKTEEDLDQVRLNKLRLDSGPSKGKPGAPVTIVEFSDLQCSSCKMAHDQMTQDKLLEQYEGKVRLIYKHKPFPNSHPWAMDAAVASMCAYQQNHSAFWKMQDQIFQEQSSITVSNLWAKLSSYAKSANLNPGKFKACYNKKETLPLINADLAEAEALNVVQTPTFFVNGRVVMGYPGTAAFKLLIDSFLNSQP